MAYIMVKDRLRMATKEKLEMVDSTLVSREPDYFALVAYSDC